MGPHCPGPCGKERSELARHTARGRNKAPWAARKPPHRRQPEESREERHLWGCHIWASWKRAAQVGGCGGARGREVSNVLSGAPAQAKSHKLESASPVKLGMFWLLPRVCDSHLPCSSRQGWGKSLRFTETLCFLWEGQVSQCAWTCFAKRRADGSHLGSCFLKRVDICAWGLKRRPHPQPPPNPRSAQSPLEHWVLETGRMGKGCHFQWPCCCN